MKSPLELQVARFLNKHWDKRRGLLLAFSGGPDSLALLHLMLPFCKLHGLSLALAHVDHAWRSESGEEAQKIIRMAEELGLTLHLTTLCPQAMEGNLEAACREARLKFFASLCANCDYQAVIVAHHTDDLAETVLKRVLEGSALPFLSGLQPIAELYGVQVWRPLLAATKQSLAAWLSVHSLKGFEDHTNLDPRFLRGRLRTKILPQLSQEFGKEVSQGLCRVAAEAAELRAYLDEKIVTYLNRLVVGKFGLLIDLSRDCPIALIELKHLIRHCCELGSFALSREYLEITAQFLLDGVADKQVVMGERRAHIDRKRLFIETTPLSTFTTAPIILKAGKLEYGPWSVEVTHTEMSNAFSSSWRTLWQGEVEVILPLGEYHLDLPNLNAPYPRSSSLAKWWTKHKIPAFLRSYAPVIYQHAEIIHEFLTGKVIPRNLENLQKFMKIKLTLRD